VKYEDADALCRRLWDEYGAEVRELRLMPDGLADLCAGALAEFRLDLAAAPVEWQGERAGLVVQAIYNPVTGAEIRVVPQQGDEDTVVVEMPVGQALKRRATYKIAVPIEESIARMARDQAEHGWPIFFEGYEPPVPDDAEMPVPDDVAGAILGLNPDVWAVGVDAIVIKKDGTVARAKMITGFRGRGEPPV
jgi:hypothetical protein